MNTSIFQLDLSIWEKIVRAALVYIFLLIILRIAGKRELGQLNIMDFVLLLILSNSVQNGIIGEDFTVSGAFIGAGTLVMINYLATFAIRKNKRFRRILIGTPSIIIENGVLHSHAMRREGLTQEDLDMAITESGGRSVTEVDKCVLEPNGRLIVSLKAQHVSFEQLTHIQRKLDELSQSVAEISRRI